jgi:hypothetical protein
MRPDVAGVGRCRRGSGEYRGETRGHATGIAGPVDTQRAEPTPILRTVEGAMGAQAG